jgi:hypothetical protein
VSFLRVRSTLWCPLQAHARVAHYVRANAVGKMTHPILGSGRRRLNQPQVLGLPAHPIPLVLKKPFNFMWFYRILRRQRGSTLILEPRLICLDDLPVILVNAGLHSRLHLRLRLQAGPSALTFSTLAGRWNNQPISVIISFVSCRPVVAGGGTNCSSN